MLKSVIVYTVFMSEFYKAFDFDLILLRADLAISARSSASSPLSQVAAAFQSAVSAAPAGLPSE